MYIESFKQVGTILFSIVRFCVEISCCFCSWYKNDVEFKVHTILYCLVFYKILISFCSCFSALIVKFKNCFRNVQNIRKNVNNIIISPIYHVFLSYQSHVKQSIEGVSALKYGLYAQTMVPILQMTDVLRVIKRLAFCSHYFFEIY